MTRAQTVACVAEIDRLIGELTNFRRRVEATLAAQTPPKPPRPPQPPPPQPRPPLPPIAAARPRKRPVSQTSQTPRASARWTRPQRRSAPVAEFCPDCAFPPGECKQHGRGAA